MFAQSITQQVRWQDFTVRNEVDMILEIAHQKDWDDCEVFGSGDMIAQTQESKGWKLIPADMYEYSIPAEAVSRVHQIINAGVRIQGVIIADDERKAESQPIPAPTRPEISLPSLKPILSLLVRALIGLLMLAGAAVLILSTAPVLVFLAPFLLLGSLFGTGSTWEYDPKLVILVDDGNGGIAWVSVFTWYD